MNMRPESPGSLLHRALHPLMKAAELPVAGSVTPETEAQLSHFVAGAPHNFQGDN